MFGIFRKKTDAAAAAQDSNANVSLPKPAESAHEKATPGEPLDIAPAAASSQPAAETYPEPIAGVEAPDHDLSPEQVEKIKEGIIEAISTVFDPEIPVNIYELGLIYNIDIAPTGSASIQMTLTSPNCPSAEELPVEVHYKTRQISGVKDVKVSVVWEPPWDPSKMTEAAKLQLGMF